MHETEIQRDPKIDGKRKRNNARKKIERNL